MLATERFHGGLLLWAARISSATDIQHQAHRSASEQPVHHCQRRRAVAHGQFTLQHDVADSPPPARQPIV
jgi:hypothetical protein